MESIFYNFNGHIKQQWWNVKYNGWGKVDLVALNNAPLAVGNPSVIVTPDQTRHVFYRDEQYHLNHISRGGNAWNYNQWYVLGNTPKAKELPNSALSAGLEYSTP